MVDAHFHLFHFAAIPASADFFPSLADLGYYIYIFLIIYFIVVLYLARYYVNVKNKTTLKYKTLLELYSDHLM